MVRESWETKKVKVGKLHISAYRTSQDGVRQGKTTQGMRHLMELFAVNEAKLMTASLVKPCVWWAIR